MSVYKFLPSIIFLCSLQEINFVVGRTYWFRVHWSKCWSDEIKAVNFSNDRKFCMFQVRTMILAEMFFLSNLLLDSMYVLHLWCSHFRTCESFDANQKSFETAFNLYTSLIDSVEICSIFSVWNLDREISSYNVSLKIFVSK